MPATRGVKRTASKAPVPSTASAASKNKKKRGGIQLEVPSLPVTRGCVFTCGQGDVGQLGLGEDDIETTKFKQVTALGNKIVSLSAGGMHTIALDSSGKVWTYGCNDEGALGRATAADTDEARPARVALPERAAVVTAGDSHSAALLENGDVYAWGAFRDSHGSMGLVVQGREGKQCKEPVKVEIGEQAAEIASGSDHLVILTVSGSVYTMGCGEQGQLGRLSQRSASRDARQGFSALLVPSKVPLKFSAHHVWAGYHATFLLDREREKMFACGLNNYGQLGISGEKRKTAVFTPLECELFRGGLWQRVAAGQHHSLALSRAGQVCAVGRCEYGRLGLGARSTDADVLEVVPKLQHKKCVSISAGTSNSFAVTDNGEVYAWGMGSEGQLGTGSANDASEPTAGLVACLAHLVPRLVAAGGQHTVLLAEDPNSKKEATPEPEAEPAEQKPEVIESKAEAGDNRRSKRQKKEEAAATSGAASGATSGHGEDEVKPQKVNGDEKSSPMEVDDETDNKQQKPENTDTEEQNNKIQDKDNENEKEENKKDQQNDEKMDTDVPETTDTSSQDTDKSSQVSTETEDSQKSEKPDDFPKSQKVPEDFPKSQKVPEDFQKSEKVTQDLQKSPELENGTDDKIDNKLNKPVDTISPLTSSA